MDVWDNSEVGTVSSFNEEGKTGEETKYCRSLLRVDFANNDEEDTSDSGKEGKEDSLGPDGLCSLVEVVGEETAHGSENDVKETAVTISIYQVSRGKKMNIQHSSPVTSTGLAKLGELRKIISAENRVDRQFSSEGGEVGSGAN